MGKKKKAKKKANKILDFEKELINYSGPHAIIGYRWPENPDIYVYTRLLTNYEPNQAGQILNTYYRDFHRVQSLAMLGDIYHLGQKINDPDPDKTSTFVYDDILGPERNPYKKIHMEPGLNTFGTPAFMMITNLENVKYIYDYNFDYGNFDLYFQIGDKGVVACEPLADHFTDENFLIDLQDCGLFRNIE